MDPQTGLPQNYDPTTGSGAPYTDATGQTPWLPNPNFFYDPNFTAAWKVRALAVMAPERSDVIRFLPGDNSTWRPESLVRFIPTPIQDDAAQPNRQPAVFSTGGGLQPFLIAPVEYSTDDGNWMGLEDDMTFPVTPTWSSA